MGPRITINLSADGEFQMWLNEEGRNLLVQELQRLSEKNDHFHIVPNNIEGVFGDLTVSPRPYYPSDKILEWGKILFRTDEWDRRYFPHVMSD